MKKFLLLFVLTLVVVGGLFGSEYIDNLSKKNSLEVERFDNVQNINNALAAYENDPSLENKNILYSLIDSLPNDDYYLNFRTDWNNRIQEVLDRR